MIGNVERYHVAYLTNYDCSGGWPFLENPISYDYTHAYNIHLYVHLYIYTYTYYTLLNLGFTFCKYFAVLMYITYLVFYSIPLWVRLAYTIYYHPALMGNTGALPRPSVVSTRQCCKILCICSVGRNIVQPYCRICQRPIQTTYSWNSCYCVPTISWRPGDSYFLNAAQSTEYHYQSTYLEC